jgi:hypothetical protein
MDHKSSKPKSFKLNLRKNWLNVLAICATILGLSTTAFFIFYTNKEAAPRPPIIFGQGYNSDTCKFNPLALATSTDTGLITFHKKL